jgi:phosphatidylethanolamine/phosphatidyl-N-methylethanolamine N-methyltransferase
MNGRLGDGADFLKSLMATPRLTGAFAPSGRALARAMAASVDPAYPGLVVELGPGTGPVTRALIERGFDRRRLVLVEFDPRFCRKLKSAEVAAFVSSLPLLNQRPHRREKLIGDAFALMGPDGVFVQFTYGLFSPIQREACAGRYLAHCGPPVWRNLPPARVWTYRAEDGAARAARAIASNVG